MAAVTRVISGPTLLPFTLAEVKLWLKLPSGTDEDSLVTDLINAAVEFVEEQTGLAIMSRNLLLLMDDFPCADRNGRRAIELSRWPVELVQSLKYYDAAGTLITLNQSVYQVDKDSKPARILPAPGTDWPETQADRIAAVEVDFIAGTEAANKVPRAVRQVLLLLIAHWYENRQEVITGTIVTKVDTAAEALIAQLKVRTLA